ncbi:unnamed protein product [Schistosoma turkestanicum]|nr:unnamed protein product [Schistosoma turkestanicum]
MSITSLDRFAHAYYQNRFWQLMEDSVEAFIKDGTTDFKGNHSFIQFHIKMSWIFSRNPKLEQFPNYSNLLKCFEKNRNEKIYEASRMDKPKCDQCKNICVKDAQILDSVIRKKYKALSLLNKGLFLYEMQWNNIQATINFFAGEISGENYFTPHKREYS